MAGVFSGALSTVSGGLNSLTAVALEDIVKLYWTRPIKEEAATKLSKCLGLGFGLFSYLLTFLVKNIPGLVQAWLGIFGIFGGPVLGLFSLGMYVPWASAKSALVSATTSLVFILWVAISGNISRVSDMYSAPQLPLSTLSCPFNTTSVINNSTTTDDDYPWIHLYIYEISYMWYSGLSCMITLILGAGLSCLPSFRQEETPGEELLVPVMEVIRLKIKGLFINDLTPEKREWIVQ